MTFLRLLWVGLFLMDKPSFCKLSHLTATADRSESGIKAVLKLLRALPAFTPQTSVSCCEHTGIYNALVLFQLTVSGLPIWLESSLQIKQAGGLQRGKSDQTDAQPVRRCGIAEYAFRFRDRLRLWQPPANSYKT
ncbi:MAG TPA: hypothetical protein VK404_19170 [Spirosoma sp.]|nr:hypothetical protein [Spirosoma sp.]